MHMAARAGGGAAARGRRETRGRARQRRHDPPAPHAKTASAPVRTARELLVSREVAQNISLYTSFYN